jgi:hypothetical protein
MEAPYPFGVIVPRLDHSSTACYRLEHVVEVVRHPAGELTQRFHALGLRGARLRLLPGCHLFAHPGFKRLVEAPKLGLALRQRCLGPLACRDVDCGPDHPYRTARGIEDSAALRSHPPYDAILLADSAVLDVVDRPLVRIVRRREGLGRCLPIIRVQTLVEVLHRHRNVG